MKKRPELLFIQRRPTRAGAQTSLFRLASSSPLPFRILTNSSGWLSEALDKVTVNPWPSPRSLKGRLGGLSLFARKYAREDDPPRIIIANDHHECLPALALAKAFSIPCVAIFRSSGMTQYDFQKHHCRDCDHLFVVGRELNERVTQWTSTPHSLFTEGFLDEEFAEIPPAPPTFPSEILAVGSDQPGKGFPDLLLALRELEKNHPDLAPQKVVFTSPPPESLPTDLRCQLEFVGRIDDFIPFAKKFHFAVHPSRHETFGLAPLELLIAGIPTLCTQTGITTEDLLPAPWLTPPSSPTELACSLADWGLNWQTNRGQLSEVVQSIRDNFAITRTAASFFETIEHLTLAS